MKKKEDLGAVVIIHIANDHRDKINSLLLRNGVQVPANASNFEVGQIVTKLLQKSKNFQKEFKNLLATPEVLNSLNQYSNATGTMDFSSYGVPSTFGGTAQPLYASQLTSPSALTSPSVLSSTSSTPVAEEKPKTGFTLDKGLGLLSQGLNGFLQYSQNETDKKLAEASIAQSQSAIYGASVIPPVEEKSNTGLIIFASIAGIAVIGGLIWYFSTQQPIKE
jgi:hypothetical protein